jgi:hypothetical protein
MWSRCFLTAQNIQKGQMTLIDGQQQQTLINALNQILAALNEPRVVQPLIVLLLLLHLVAQLFMLAKSLMTITVIFIYTIYARLMSAHRNTRK